MLRLLCLSCAHYTSGNPNSIIIPSDLISTSTGSTASDPYTNEKGVAPVEVLTIVWYSHKAYGSLSDQTQ